MIIKLDSFNGMAPKLAPPLLPQTAAQTARNCKFYSGALDPWHGPSAPVNTPTKIGTKLSILLYEKQYWFHWLTDVNAVTSPLGDDSYKRVYYTGDGAPKMTALDIAVQGGTNYPVASYPLGLPAPANTIIATPEAYSAASTYAVGYIITYNGAVYRCKTAITVAEAFNSAKWGLVLSTDLVDVAYTYCYVTGYGEIGPPAPASASVTIGPGQKVIISNMSPLPAGGYNITSKRVYRTNTGTNATDYQWVIPSAYPSGLVPAAVQSLTDDCASAALGAVMTSKEWIAPPSDLVGIIVTPYGSMVGFHGKEVCFTPPYQPHAWPRSYRYPVDYPVVGLGAFGTSVLVATEGVPYLLTGNDPAALSMEKMEVGYSCVSKRSVVDMGYAVMYAAPDGLVIAGSGQYDLATKETLSRDYWQGLKPSSISGFLFNGQYVGFYDTGTVQGGFVFNPATKDFALIDLYATAGYTDPATGKLYLQIGNNIVQWDAGSDMAFTWKSKPFRAVKPVNFAVAQVFADAYPVTLSVYADGALVGTETVGGPNPIPLLGGFLADVWEIELSGSTRVNSVNLATSVAELRKA